MIATGGWVVITCIIIPLCGSLLQVETCQILRIAENPRWSPVWQYNHIWFIFIVFKCQVGCLFWICVLEWRDFFLMGTGNSSLLSNHLSEYIFPDEVNVGLWRYHLLSLPWINFFCDLLCIFRQRACLHTWLCEWVSELVSEYVDQKHWFWRNPIPFYVRPVSVQ